MHEVEGVAHTSRESDPRSAEYLASDGAVEGGEVGEKDESGQGVVEIASWSNKDRDPYNKADNIPPTAGSRFGACSAEVCKKKATRKN